MTDETPTPQTQSPQAQSSQTATFLLTAIVFTVLGVVLAAVYFQNADDDTSDVEIEQIVQNTVATQMALSGAGASAPVATATRVPVEDAADDDAFKGPADAPVVIVEFSDYRCPYCERFYSETLPDILETYPDEVKFVYRDFPIFGEESARAGMATECAEEQDAFWDMHDRIFQARGEENPETLTLETLVSYAGDLDLDTDAFAECLSSERYLDEVVNDYQAAAGYGFTGTPSFLINGQYINGAQPFAVFEQIIESELENNS